MFWLIAAFPLLALGGFVLLVSFRSSRRGRASAWSGASGGDASPFLMSQDGASCDSGSSDGGGCDGGGGPGD